MNQPEEALQDVASAECGICGLSSTLPELFSPWYQSPTGRICPRCSEQRQASHYNSYLTAILLFAAMAAVLWAVGHAKLGLYLAGIGTSVLAIIPLTILHELAHALTALCLGMTVHSVELGWYGDRLFQFRLGRCKIDVTRLPFGGATRVSATNLRWIRLRMSLVIAAGPLLHFLLIANAATYLIVVHDFGFHSGVAVWFATVFLSANTGMLVVSLFTSRSSDRRGPVVCDGLQLLAIPRLTDAEAAGYAFLYFYHESWSQLRDRNLIGARETLRQGLQQFPESFDLRYNQAFLHLEENDSEEAARRFYELRAHPDVTPEANALLLNNIAWCLVVSQNGARLAEAKELSASALAALPWRPEVKGTHGSVLVLSSYDREGTALLEEAWKENTDDQIRAVNAIYLGIAAARRGDRNTALEWIRRAEQLGPRKQLLQQARAEVAELLGGTDVQ